MKILSVLLLLLCAPCSHAQDYGFVVGLHQSTAKLQGMSASPVLGFDLGLAMSLEFVPNVRFKTGAIYNERHVDFKSESLTTTYKFAYVDVPLNAQYNFTDKFGIFGGVIVAINVNDNVHAPRGTPSFDPGAKALYPLLNAGVSLLFRGDLGVDFYYEAGLGAYAKSLQNLRSSGFNLTYWF